MLPFYKCRTFGFSCVGNTLYTVMYAVISVLEIKVQIYKCETFAFICVSNTLYTVMYVVVSVLVKKVVEDYGHFRTERAFMIPK